MNSISSLFALAIARRTVERALPCRRQWSQYAAWHGEGHGMGSNGVSSLRVTHWEAVKLSE